MLVLSRKQNERIRVGDSIVVTIVRVSGDKVRIGIEAPANVRVLRDELHTDGGHPGIVPALESVSTERVIELRLATAG
ncbi:MAG: carbon storage regulator [Planctomycetaceae bacterium]|nr:carbon storage regulator [Planctomycetaceae bacterium]